MGYERKYNAILLVGLTELKAQIGWIDPETVREISFNLHPLTSSDLHMRGSRGQRKGL